jgi:hypothetical protein
MTTRQFWQALVAIVAVVVLMILLLLAQFGWQTVTLSAIFSSLVAVILAMLAGVVLAMMLNGRINLSLLISEDNGNASLSRFQFLIFTFVIAASYFLFVLASLANMPGMLTAVGAAKEALAKNAADPAALEKLKQAADAVANFQLPQIPAGVLGLIGLSGGSYVIAKGIQKSAETDQGQSVQKIEINTKGAGYPTDGSHVHVTLNGGGGMNATAFATVVTDGATAGSIKEIIITSQGSGYVTPPDVVIDAPTTGTQATAKAVLG